MRSRRPDHREHVIRGTACVVTLGLHLAVLTSVFVAPRQQPTPTPEPQLRVQLSLLPPAAPPQPVSPPVAAPTVVAGTPARQRAPAVIPEAVATLSLMPLRADALWVQVQEEGGGQARNEHAQVTAAPATAVAPPPSPSLPPAVSSSGQRDPSWEGEVLAHLERYRRYPNAARARRQQGTAHVLARVDRDGDVLSAVLRDGSGSVTLDRAALETFARAEPLPRPPSTLPAPVEIDVPVEFFLR